VGLRVIFLGVMVLDRKEDRDWHSNIDRIYNKKVTLLGLHY